MALNHVDIIGIGAVTGYGWGMADTWAGLMAGQTCARQYTGLGGAFPDPCWYARVPDDCPPQARRPGLIQPTRYTQAITAVAEEALADARARGWRPGERVGLIHGTSGADREVLRGRYHGSPRRFLDQVWTVPPGQVMIDNQFLGPSMVLSAACSSGLHGIAMAQRLINCGDATDVLVTAADIGYDGEEMQIFARLGGLIYDGPPDEHCRPFHEDTLGFTLGEGAAAVLVTAAPHDAGYLRVRSTVLANDAHHPTQIEPSGRHLLRVVDRAIADADVDRESVRVYNAHATGTQRCNEADEFVLDALGKQAVAYGLKPLLGHTMGTAPLLETAVLVKSYVEGFLPAPKAVSDRHHPQLAPGPMKHPGGLTTQLGLGFGGNVGVAVYEPLC